MTLDSTVYALVKDLVGAEPLVFADQNAPRPPLPYWTLLVQTNRQLGSATYSQGVTNDGDLEVSGVREATVRIQRMGADSVSKVTDLRDDTSRTTVLEKWQLQKISLYNVGDVQNVPFKLDNSQLEPRAVLDLSIRHGTKILDNVSAIETVDISADFIDHAGVNGNFTVVL